MVAVKCSDCGFVTVISAQDREFDGKRLLDDDVTCAECGGSSFSLAGTSL